MPGSTRTRRVLLFALPLAAYAALLAGATDGESPLAAAMPRVILGSVIATGVAWLASGIDNGRGGRWIVVVGLAMAMCAAGSVAFALSLAVAIMQSGVGAFTVFAMAFFGAMIGVVMLIVIHVIETCLEVGWRTAAAAIAAHAVTMTVLITAHDRAASTVVAVASLGGGMLALLIEGALGRRTQKKNRP